MESKKLLMSVVTVCTFVLLFVSMASASVAIRNIEMNDADVLYNGVDLSSYSGQSVPVKVVFEAFDDASDARVKAWISGSSGLSATTERFDLIAGKDYVRSLQVMLPDKTDPDESFEMIVTVESRNGGILAQERIDFTVQRESYTVEILDLNMDNRVMAGATLAMDLVLKNRGRHFAEDTFVKAKIPALGVEEKAYFGDLSPVDQANPDKEDAAERRMSLRIPSNAKPGIYNLEVEAYNDDSTATLSRKVVVLGASEDSMVVTPAKSKTFAPGASAEYSLTLVNSGDKVRVYKLVLDAPAGLSVDAEEPLLAIPAGSSKTVKIKANAAKAGVYDFTASVQSNGDLVKKESFVANVEGTKVSGAVGQNTTVLLTVVLAIIFVVLLVVLIVLLTRKPEKAKEFGESYY